MARLHTRKFGQAPILLQALSSHPHLFIMFLCESMNFHPDKQLFPSCRRRGSNRWLLDYKASALPLHHGGHTIFEVKGVSIADLTCFLHELLIIFLTFLEFSKKWQKTPQHGQANKNLFHSTCPCKSWIKSAISCKIVIFTDKAQYFLTNISFLATIDAKFLFWKR